MSETSEKYSGVDSDQEIEPGACRESILITTDSIEEFSQEMSSSLNDDSTFRDGPVSLISEIQEEITEKDQSSSSTTTDTTTNLQVDDDGSTKTAAAVTSTKAINCDKIGDKMNNMNIVPSTSNGRSVTRTNDDKNRREPSNERSYMDDPEWYTQKRHVFIMSIAGKPIYSLHGSEEKLAPLFGVMQAIHSHIEVKQDLIRSIQAAGLKIVFLIRVPLILVCVSRDNSSVQQIQLHLTDVYSQIISTLTLPSLTRSYELRNNIDFRSKIAGTERFIQHLLTDESYTSNNPFMYLTHSVRILPMNQNIRDQITSAIQSNCSKIKNLVFAILIAKNKLITLVKMKKCSIHPADLRIIFNLVECSENFKNGENWIPICLPKFDATGYLYTYLSYVSEDCDACLLLMSVEAGAFETLSNAKSKITEKLRRSNCLEAINEAMIYKGINLKVIGIPEIRHFIYKSKSTAQLLCSEITIPYNSPGEFERLRSIYYEAHHRMHNTTRPLKLIYEMKEKELILAWITTGYELYVILEPLIDKNNVISAVNKLLKWIKKEESLLFILNAPHF